MEFGWVVQRLLVMSVVMYVEHEKLCLIVLRAKFLVHSYNTI